MKSGFMILPKSYPALLSPARYPTGFVAPFPASTFLVMLPLVTRACQLPTALLQAGLASSLLNQATMDSLPAGWYGIAALVREGRRKGHEWSRRLIQYCWFPIECNVQVCILPTWIFQFRYSMLVHISSSESARFHVMTSITPKSEASLAKPSLMYKWKSAFS